MGAPLSGPSQSTALGRAYPPVHPPQEDPSRVLENLISSCMYLTQLTGKELSIIKEWTRREKKLVIIVLQRVHLLVSKAVRGGACDEDLINCYLILFADGLAGKKKPSRLDLLRELTITLLRRLHPLFPENVITVEQLNKKQLNGIINIVQPGLLAKMNHHYRSIEPVINQLFIKLINGEKISNKVILRAYITEFLPDVNTEDLEELSIAGLEKLDGFIALQHAKKKDSPAFKALDKFIKEWLKDICLSKKKLKQALKLSKKRVSFNLNVQRVAGRNDVMFSAHKLKSPPRRRKQQLPCTNILPPNSFLEQTLEFFHQLEVKFQAGEDRFALDMVFKILLGERATLLPFGKVDIDLYYDLDYENQLYIDGSALESYAAQEQLIDARIINNGLIHQDWINNKAYSQNEQYVASERFIREQLDRYLEDSGNAHMDVKHIQAEILQFLKSKLLA